MGTQRRSMGDPPASIIAIGAGSYRPGDTADHVRVKTVNRDSRNEDRVVGTLEIDAGFHINAHPASLDYLIPTTLNVTKRSSCVISDLSPARMMRFVANV